jgi:IclR family transcriptional regulator, KDG regulon repressor
MYNAPVIKRALDIIRLIVKEQRHLGITEIAQTLSINKSTAFGILRSLEEQGFIVKDKSSKKYSMGQQLFELSKMVFKRTDIATIAKPFLERLVELVEETVFMGVKEEDRLKIVQVVEAKKDLKISSPIGAYLPIMAGAAGKACLSAMKDKEIEDLVDRKGLPHFTDNSINDMDYFMKEIHATRRTGYAIDLEEYIKGIRGIATLIRSEGEPLAALWIAGFTSSMTDQKLPKIARHLLLAAQLIGTRVESQMGPNHLDNVDEMTRHFLTENGRADADP